jgi:uncharacterized protein YegP (UPF0339 family)
VAVVTEDDERRAREITDEIHVSAASALNSIDAVKKEVVQARRKDGAFWFAMVLTAVAGPSLAVLFSAYNTNQTELKFCSLMDASVAQAQQRVAGYDQAPPTTDAGREQRANAIESVKLLTNLQRSLGCPIEEGKL